MTTPQLGPETRVATLAALAHEQFDVLVIGGGITGAGAALDAASRGLKTALVEMRDFAAGTSSRSGKLIHGGLRYLEQLNFGLVRESLRERRLFLQTLAPHLTRPLCFLYPLRHRVWERAYMGAGLVLYDSIGGAGAVPRHRHLSFGDVQRIAPGIDRNHLIGALTFYDVQIDDSRYTLELVRTAVSHGASAASSLKVIDLLKNAGRVVGARVADIETGNEFEIRANAVVNAAGVWTDELQAMSGGTASFAVKASKGVHIMVPREKIRSDLSLFLRAEDSVLFVRTWGRHWLIGTTDTAWTEELDHPAATSTDIEYLLRNLNSVLDTPLTRDDIDGVFVGLRPLVRGKEGATSALSREHAVETSVPGFTSIAGGKYTTYRVMGEDVINEATASFSPPVPKSRTHEIPMLGAIGFEGARDSITQAARSNGISEQHATHLLGRYGVLTRELLSMIESRPELAQPIDGAEDYLLVEAVYAASHEAALHLEDILARRTHISIETADRGVRAAASIAPLVAEVLGWDNATSAREISDYNARVEAEIASQRLPDDASAEATRLTARDPRMRIADHKEDETDAENR